MNERCVLPEYMSDESSSSLRLIDLLLFCSQLHGPKFKIRYFYSIKHELILLMPKYFDKKKGSYT